MSLRGIKLDLGYLKNKLDLGVFMSFDPLFLLYKKHFQEKHFRLIGRKTQRKTKKKRFLINRNHF